MIAMTTIQTKSGGICLRRAWTGGDVATTHERRTNPYYRELVSYFFKEQLKECGGLDFWKCAGTSSMERARIFWERAKLDAWRTYTERERELI